MGSLSSPFFGVLVFWLIVIFLCFGLSAPFNHLSFTVTGRSALALASALFVIMDLYTPYTGLFTVSNLPARRALQQMLSLPKGLPPPVPAACNPATQSCEGAGSPDQSGLSGSAFGTPRGIRRLSTSSRSSSMAVPEDGSIASIAVSTV
jgi:hypothetical protein